MKKLLLSLLCCVSIYAYAQDTLKKTNKVGKFEELLTVLKSDKKVKQGSYKLMLDEKLVAAGNYDKGKRVGLWSFYAGDQLEQQYDYNTNKLISNTLNQNIKCEIESAVAGDSIKPAIKVGGYLGGLKLLVAYANFDSNISGSGRNSIDHVITIDENGKATSWMALVKNADGIKVLTQSLADVPEELLQFYPAVLNGQKIASTLTFHNEQMVAGAGGPGGFDGSKPRGGGGRKGRN